MQTRPCGLGIINPMNNANDEYNQAREITDEFEKCNNATWTHIHAHLKIKNWRSLIQKKLTVNEQNNLNLLWEKMPYMETRLFGVAQEQGSTSWITVLPIRRLGFS